LIFNFFIYVTSFTFSSAKSSRNWWPHYRYPEQYSNVAPGDRSRYSLIYWKHRRLLIPSQLNRRAWRVIVWLVYCQWRVTLPVW